MIENNTNMIGCCGESLESFKALVKQWIKEASGKPIDLSSININATAIESGTADVNISTDDNNINIIFNIPKGKDGSMNITDIIDIKYSYNDIISGSPDEYPLEWVNNGNGSSKYIAIKLGETNWSIFKINTESESGNFILPVATEDILGGVKIGKGLTINNNGLLSLKDNILENRVQYIYCRLAEKPSKLLIPDDSSDTEKNNPNNVFLPSGPSPFNKWSLTPKGTDNTYKYEYISMRTFVNNNGKYQWSAFSLPVLISSYNEIIESDDLQYSIVPYYYGEDTEIPINTILTKISNIKETVGNNVVKDFIEANFDGFIPLQNINNLWEDYYILTLHYINNVCINWDNPELTKVIKGGKRTNILCNGNLLIASDKSGELANALSWNKEGNVKMNKLDILHNNGKVGISLYIDTKGEPHIQIFSKEGEPLLDLCNKGTVAPGVPVASYCESFIYKKLDDSSIGATMSIYPIQILRQEGIILYKFINGSVVNNQGIVVENPEGAAYDGKYFRINDVVSDTGIPSESMKASMVGTSGNGERFAIVDSVGMSFIKIQNGIFELVNSCTFDYYPPDQFTDDSAYVNFEKLENGWKNSNLASFESGYFDIPTY